MWKNIVEPNGLHMTIRCKGIACWILKAADTHLEYVILVLFHCNSGYKNVPLCHMYIACGNLQFTGQVRNVLDEVLMFLRQNGVLMSQGQRV
jgi:hypothetical protein